MEEHTYTLADTYYIRDIKYRAKNGNERNQLACQLLFLFL